jgi:acetylornithine deacetylase
VLAILQTLIGFDTTSRNSNLALIAWVEEFLAARGLAFTRVANAERDKANLYALIGPSVEGGVILSGHTDVVPVDGQAWDTAPFELTARGDRLYGRGTADMKSFLALVLGHIDAALQAKLKRPIILAFSYDEEIGCLGAPSMIADLAKHIPAPSAAIVGEPTMMKVLSGHKGVTSFIVDVEGLEAHSSAINQGISAIMAGLPLMNLIDQMGKEAAAKADPHSLFDPPHATMTIGVVEGGTAVNILARHLRFVWDLRCPPEDDPELYVRRFQALAEEIDHKIKMRAPEGGVTVTRRSNTTACAVVRDSTAETLARRLTGDNSVGVASYGAEAGLFQKAGFPVVLCGPGDIAQAHQPNEWIARDQIELGARFMERLIADLTH